ncbi:DUF2202 domain-containing protein [Fusibacter paucivorans]|uniref:DUF2202 domain-containing protein n=1 Tax=Fusibacter paucivorans TaxID=76009 RepID=A0ABS5PTQ2_9FIRM|nr:DUF2202 domain-containing protein [Fusibacter paucivorans]MBS7528549.1 DUF2202 domain-containing protein [Fusibacter paucivorans]
MKKNMNKKGTKLMGIMIAASMLIGSALSFADTTNTDFGSSGALAQETSITLEAMLDYAIQDEYAALAEYEAIMTEFGVQRPFTNISKAEETHIEWLLPLFETYGYDVPENTAADMVVVPETLAETYAIGVTAEINNIDMYEMFLETDLPDDVAVVFEALKNASVNHLNAFERQTTTATGLGKSNVQSNGQGGRGNGNRAANQTQTPGNGTGQMNGFRNNQ